MELIIFIIFLLIYFVVYLLKSSALTTPGKLLTQVFSAQGFTNLKTVYYNSALTIVRANAKGENYLFAYRNDTLIQSPIEVMRLHDYAKKLHIHSAVLISYNPISSSHPSYKKVREYNIDVWDATKMMKLCQTFDAANSTAITHHILKTSDTSDDTCKIDTNSFDPIQENPASSNIFSGLFHKPDHL